MRALVSVAVLAIMLSGCSNGSGLTTYIVQPGDAAGCSLMPMSDEALQEARDEAGLTGNPGRINNELLERDGVAPIDNLVSIYQCGEEQEEQAVAQAMRFANDTDAADWMEASQYCQFAAEGVLQDGPIIAMANGPGNVESAWHTRVTNQTAAQLAC